MCLVHCFQISDVTMDHCSLNANVYDSENRCIIAMFFVKNDNAAQWHHLQFVTLTFIMLFCYHNSVCSPMECHDHGCAFFHSVCAGPVKEKSG